MATVSKQLFAQGLKRCGTCKSVLPLTAFNKSSTRSDGHRGQCRGCECNGRRLQRALTTVSGRALRERQRNNPPAYWNRQRCCCCEREFARRSRDERSDALRFCSRECAFEWKRFLSANRQAIAVTNFCKCEGCGKRFIGSRLALRYCSSICRNIALKAPPRSLVCCKCGRKFAAQGKAVSGKRFCSNTCRKTANRTSLTYKRCKAKARKAGKLRKRGVTVESVDPIRVLERDGWTCQLCGVRTPKRLRGTYEDCAPEVDHIVPIAVGGEHSYRNTQCACRKCNIAKGARPMGQLRLVA